jgi:hypothetical protein
MNTVFVVDARNRERLVYAASATTLFYNPSAIVLRKGVTMGKIEDVLIGRVLDCPILVMGAYHAQSSAGHVTPLGFEKFQQATVVGGAGFGYEAHDAEGKRVRRGDALRPFGKPIEATLLPSGTQVQKLETHHGSNCATAEAAFTGLELMADAPATAILVEGQSDHTSAVTFRVPEKTEQSEFPIEHREETFSKKSLLATALRGMTHPSKDANEEDRKPVYQQGRIFITLQVLRAIVTAKDGSEAVILPPSVMELVGDDLSAICDELIAEYVDAGWKFGVDMQFTNQFTLAVAPNGTRVLNTSIKCFNRTPANLYVAAATANSEEEKRASVQQ